MRYVLVVFAAGALAAQKRCISVETMLSMTAGAGFDQGDRHPDEWGEGWDAYGVRVASHFGQNLATVVAGAFSHSAGRLPPGA